MTHKTPEFKKKKKTLAQCYNFVSVQFHWLLSAEHQRSNDQLKATEQSSTLQVDSWNLISQQSGWVSIGKHWRVTNMEPLGEGQEPRATNGH